jgi:hypothetical protein
LVTYYSDVISRRTDNWGTHTVYATDLILTYLWMFCVTGHIGCTNPL